MRKKALLSGTVDEQLRQVDRLLHKMVRRSAQAIAIVHVPPIPVMSSGYNAETGVLIKAVIPTKGVIASVALFAEMAEGVKISQFEASVISPRTTQGVGFTIKGPLTLDDLNLEVEPGDILVIKALAPEEIIDASASALYKMEAKHTDVSHMLLDELDKIEEDITS